MKKQIEHIDWSGQRAISKHHQFFNDMGHGSDWREK
jgi:hypothetical protein